MARSSSMWWPWVQRHLDAHGWTNADLAHAIAAQAGGGPDESVIGRWRNRSSAPTRKSALAVAEAFHVDPRKALVAAGLVTAEELAAPWADSSRVDLTAVPDEALAAEVSARLVRRRRAATPRPQRQPATAGNGPSRTTIATTGPGSRHVVPAETTTAPPPSEEDEGTGADVERCG